MTTSIVLDLNADWWIVLAYRATTVELPKESRLHVRLPRLHGSSTVLVQLFQAIQ